MIGDTFASSDDYRFVLHYSDVEMKFCTKTWKRLVSIVQNLGCGCTVLYGIFSLAYTGILCTNKVSFKYRIIADKVLSWGQQCTHHLTATSRRNTLFRKPKIVTDWFMAHGQKFAALNWTSQSSAFNLREHIYAVVERVIQILKVLPRNLE